VVSERNRASTFNDLRKVLREIADQ